MKTKEEITKEFMTELNALLLKYKAEIKIEDNYIDWVSDPKIELYIESQYDTNGNCIFEGVFGLNLGTYLDGTNGV